MRYIFLTILLLGFNYGTAQPQPCGSVPIMSNTCAGACVICDIDGFTGTNNLQAGGQWPGNVFCSTPNDMHYIAFIAGTTSLSIQITVTNCNTNGGWQSLDLGFYESIDCQNFNPITTCREDLEGGDSFIFNTNQPLVVGQHYYLVMDGTNGSICDWTFNVIDGSTAVESLSESGSIVLPDEVCPNIPVSIDNIGVSGAALYFWSIDGVSQSAITQSFEFEFPEDGVYEICVSAANACDEAPQICDSIKVRTPLDTELVEVICDLDCVEVNGTEYCDSGFYFEYVSHPNGCDSVVTLDLTVLPQARESVDVWICNTDTFFIGQSPYTETGEFEETILTTLECDSLVLLDLLVIECEIIGDTYEYPVVCNGTPTGILVFSVEQGTPPLSYTYTNIIDGSITGTGTTNLLVDNQIPNIPAGTYQIYIEDDFGNDVVVLQEVTEPTIIESTLTPSEYGDYNISCFMDDGLPGADGELTANFTGGVLPYAYLWSDGQTDQTAIGLSAGQYEVTMTDAAGCEKIDTYTLTAPPEILSDILFTDPNCDGFETGVIQLESVEGGTPDYLYRLGEEGSFASDSLYDNLVEGIYTFFIQDANDCVVAVIDSIFAPDIPTVELGDNLTVLLGDSILLEPLINNTNLSEITWSNSTTLSCANCLEPYANTVNDTEYILTLVSEDLCTRSDSIAIKVEKRRRVYVPNVFSPNGDPLNSKVIFNTGPEADLVENFSIFDRWGNIVFEGIDFAPNNESAGWNGRNGNIKLNPGVYVWTADVHFIDGVSLPYSGQITLVK